MIDDEEIPLLRTSERGDFGRCWWLWQKHWVEGISPLRAPTWSIFGTAVHKALEFYYPPGIKRRNMNEAIEVFHGALDDQGRKVGVDIEELEDEIEERNETAERKKKLVRARDLGPAMLTGYRDFYGAESEWEVIHTEQPFQIDVPDPRDPGRTLVVYAGTWDVLMRHRPTRRLWLWDHKTCAAFPQVEELELNRQKGSYLWVAKEVLVHKGILTKKDRISGIEFNYLRKALPDERPTDSRGQCLNKDGSVSKRQPSPRFMRIPQPYDAQAAVRQAAHVQDEAILMEMVRDGALPLLKSVQKDCPRCILFDLCTAHEAGDDWELIQDELYTSRDPYEDHREAMQEGGIEL